MTYIFFWVSISVIVGFILGVSVMKLTNGRFLNTNKADVTASDRLVSMAIVVLIVISVLTIGVMAINLG